MVNKYFTLLLIACCCVLILNYTEQVVLGDNINKGVFALNSRPYNTTYEDWTIKFWQWLSSIPADKNPVVDQTGELCGESQTSLSVFFLAFSSSGGAERTCTIPAGKAILVPINVVLCDLTTFPGARTDEDLHTCAREDESSNPGLYLSVDRKEFKELSKYRVHSRAFDFNLPEDPWFGEPGPSRGVSDGYWAILEPLPVGEHEINFKASLTNPTTGILFYSDDLKYRVNVK